VGSALTFDGTNDAYTWSNPMNEAKGAFSLWMYPDFDVLAETPKHYAYSSGFRTTFWAYGEGTGKFQFRTDSAFRFEFTPPSTWSQTWVFCVLNYSTAGSELLAALPGSAPTQEASATGDHSAGAFGTTFHFAEDGFAGNHWLGRLAHFATYNDELSIGAATHAMNHGFYPPLLVDYRRCFEDTCVEWSGNGRTATKVGAPVVSNGPPVVPYSARLWRAASFTEVPAAAVIPELNMAPVQPAGFRI